MSVSPKLAVMLVAIAFVAVSIARAATAPANISNQYYSIERAIEQRAGVMALATTQTDQISGDGYAGELTMRDAYSSSSGPGIPCGACTDPCRSFSLSVTIVGGNGRFIGDVCLTPSGWRVLNISQRNWVNQPGQAAPPPPPPPMQTQARTVVYRDYTFDDATVTAIRSNLVRLNYIDASNNSASELSRRLDVFVQDNNVTFSENEAQRAQQIIALVGRTSEAVARSTAPTEECAQPRGPNSAGRFIMCGRIGRSARATQ